MKEIILLAKYKYIILSIFAILEGPVVSLVSGFLVRLGHLKFLPVIIILLLGDIVSDSVYYFLAIKSNGEEFIKKYANKYKTISENFNLLENLWRQHGVVTMFVAKFAYGFTIPLVISAAISKVPYKKLMLYIIPPTILKYSLLVIIGYYLAHEYNTAEKYIYSSAIYVPIVILLFFLSYKLSLKYLKKKASGF